MFRYKETVLNKPSSELGVESLKLNLPLPHSTQLGVSNDVEDAEDRHFLEHVATSGGLVNLYNGSILSWKCLKLNKILELEIVDLTNSREKMTRKVLIESPLAMKDNCVTVSSDVAAVVVDFIAANGILYTVRVPFEEFNEQKSTRLTNKNAKDWRSIKNPYSFDMKPPHIMHAVDDRTLIIGLQDGNVIRFDREDGMSVINTTVFQDSQGLSFSRLLPWNHSDRVPGRNDLSMRTCVAIKSIGNMLVTLSINRMLRVWNLENSMLVSEKDVMGVDNSNKEQLLDPNPAKLIALVGQYIVTYVPLEDGIFKIWSQELEMLQQVNAQMPDKSAVWIAADLKIVEEKNWLKLWVVWKSDTSSCVQSVRIGFKGDIEPWVQTQQAGRITEDDNSNKGEHKFVKVDSKDESEYFIEKIFGPGGFSFQTLRTALPIYAQHFSLDIDSNDLKGYGQDLSKLKKAVCHIVGAAVSMSTIDEYGNNDYKGYNQDLALQWTRFERLCSELEKQGHEALALEIGKNGNIYLLKATFLGIIRTLGDIELYWNNKSTDPASPTISMIAAQTETQPETCENILKIMEFMSSFRHGVSHTVLAHLNASLREDYMKVRHNFATSERIVEYYQEHFAPHLTDYALGVLATQMAEIGNIDDTLAVIRQLIEKTDDNNNGQKVIEDGGTITKYGSQFLGKVVYENALICRQTTLDILALVVISSCQDDFVQEEVTAFANHLAQLRELSCVIHALTNSACNNTVLSFMEHLLDTSFKNFSNQTLSTLHANIWSQLINTDTSAAQLAIQMHQRGVSQTSVLEFVNEFVTSKNSFGAFIKGILGKDDRWLSRAAVGAGNLALSATQQAIVSLLSPDLKLGQGISAYYQSVAVFVMEQYNDANMALRLAKLAVQTAESISPSIYETWFEIALKAKSFDGAYVALMELVTLEEADENIDSKVEYLVMSMIAHGQSKRMCRYPFIGISQKVTQVLESQGYRQSLAKILYSWKLERGDYRGAAEALYSEIQHVRLVSVDNNDDQLMDQSVIRDLYETVLNVLGVIEPKDDQWIVVDSVHEVGENEHKRARTVQGLNGFRQEKRALKYADVADEYAEFVRGLEGQLKKMVL